MMIMMIVIIYDGDLKYDDDCDPDNHLPLGDYAQPMTIIIIMIIINNKNQNNDNNNNNNNNNTSKNNNSHLPLGE